MADLATTGAADATGFADGEVREVVVEEEFLLGSAAGVGVEILRVLVCAECNERHGLRFTTRENRRAVRTG